MALRGLKGRLEEKGYVLGWRVLWMRLGEMLGGNFSFLSDYSVALDIPIHVKT